MFFNQLQLTIMITKTIWVSNVANMGDVKPMIEIVLGSFVTLGINSSHVFWIKHTWASLSFGYTVKYQSHQTVWKKTFIFHNMLNKSLTS